MENGGFAQGFPELLRRFDFGEKCRQGQTPSVIKLACNPNSLPSSAIFWCMLLQLKLLPIIKMIINGQHK